LSPIKSPERAKYNSDGCEPVELSKCLLFIFYEIIFLTLFSIKSPERAKHNSDGYEPIELSKCLLFIFYEIIS